jgi:hypothetical protein
MVLQFVTEFFADYLATDSVEVGGPYTSSYLGASWVQPTSAADSQAQQLARGQPVLAHRLPLAGRATWYESSRIIRRPGTTFQASESGACVHSTLPAESSVHIMCSWLALCFTMAG